MVESIYFLKPAWCGTHRAGLWPEQDFQSVTVATAFRRWFSLWNDCDDTKDLTENPLYKLKTEYAIKNDIIVWRDHDHMHSMKPDFTVVGSLRSVGVKGAENAVMAPRIYTIPETTLGEPGDNPRRVRRAGEAADRVPRVSLRRRSECEGQQDPLRS